MIEKLRKLRDTILLPHFYLELESYKFRDVLELLRNLFQLIYNNVSKGICISYFNYYYIDPFMVVNGINHIQFNKMKVNIIAIGNAMFTSEYYDNIVFNSVYLINNIILDMNYVDGDLLSLLCHTENNKLLYLKEPPNKFVLSSSSFDMDQHIAENISTYSRLISVKSNLYYFESNTPIVAVCDTDNSPIKIIRHNQNGSLTISDYIKYFINKYKLDIKIYIENNKLVSTKTFSKQGFVHD